MSAHSGYRLFLIGLGHLCNHVTSLNRASVYAGLWDRIDWHRTVGEMTGETTSWWLIDEKLSNQKFLMVSADEPHAADVKLAAEQLKNRLRAIVQPYPSISASMPRTPFPAISLGQVAQDLRSGLEKRGAWRIRLIGDVARTQRKMARIRCRRATILKALADAGKGEQLRQLLFRLFHSWAERGLPQRKAEKGFIDIAERIGQRDFRSERGEWLAMEAAYWKRSASPLRSKRRAMRCGACWSRRSTRARPWTKRQSCRT